MLRLGLEGYQSAMLMNKKKALIRALLLFSFVGSIFIAYPFFASLSISANSLNNSIVSCSVKQMKPGQIIECGRASIYRRTIEDRRDIDKFSYLLQDPQSIYSKQPDDKQNRWRSKNTEYFIYYSFAPKRGCPLIFNKPKKFEISWYEPPEVEALESLPYFTEQCEGRTWDTSGRVYYRKGYPEEFNLIVPKTNWVSTTNVQVYGG